MSAPAGGRNPAVTLGLVAVLCLLLGLFAGMWAQERVAPPAAPSRLSDADVAFARSMLLAHRDAVLVTRLLPADASPGVRIVADEVMASQWRTAGQMTGWLEASGLTDPDPLPEFGHAHGQGPSLGTASAPGSAPAPAPPVPADTTVVDASDLTRLAELSGPEREETYLRVMIRHQERSVALVDSAREGLSDPAVRRAADVMVADRVEAVELMAGALAERGVGSAPVR